MILMSTKEPARLTPPYYVDADGNPLPGAPVYHVRAGSVSDRQMLEADLAGSRLRAGRVATWELRDAALAGIAALLDGAMLERASAVVTAYFDAESELQGEDAALWAAIEERLHAAPSEYASLADRAMRRNELLPSEAAQRFLVGWDGLDVPFATDAMGRVSQEALRAVPLIDLRWIGFEAYRMLYASAARPFSGAATKSESVPATSPSDAATLGASRGRSTAKPGRKTPG